MPANSLQKTLLLFCLVMATLSATAKYHFADSSVSQHKWIGPATGYWDEPANWSQNQVPQGGADVTIDSSTVLLAINATCRTLHLNHHAKLTLINNARLLVTNGIPDSARNDIILYSSPVPDTSRNILLISMNAAQDIKILNDSVFSFASLEHIKNINRPSLGPLPVNQVQVNDFLLADTMQQLPHGLLAKVTAAKQDSSGSWVVTVINASLDSLYKKLDYHWEKKFDTLQLNGGFDVRIPKSSNPPLLTVAGAYKLYITSGVTVKIEDAKLKQAEAKVEGGIILSAKNTTGFEDLQKDTTINLREDTLFASDKLFVGKVQLPFTFTGILRTNLKIKAGGTMQLSSLFKYQNVSYVKLSYDGGLIPAVTGNLFETVADTAGMVSKIKGTYSAGIEAQLKINFFKQNKTGLTAALTASGILEGDCTSSGLRVSGKVSAEGTVGGEIDLFNIVQLQPSLTLFKLEKNLFTKDIDDGGMCPEDPETPGTSISHGDIHAVSFDRNIYDFQSFGEFIAAADSNFVVQVRQAGGTDKRVTFNKAIAATNGKDTVEFGIDTLHIYVNGKAKKLNQRIELKGGGYVQHADNFVTIRFGTGERIEILYWEGRYFNYTLFATNDHRKRLRGLMGDWDGLRENDFSLRNGQLLDTVDFKHIHKAFADAWRIADNESLFTYPHGKSTIDFTDYSYPSLPIDLPANDINKARTACIQAGVTTEPALSACIIDVGVTGDTSYAQSAASIQTQYQTKDPVAWLLFDGDGLDKSPFGNNALLYNEYSFVADRKGRPGHALRLNGKGYAAIDNNPMIKALSNSISVSGWILVDGFDRGWASFVCKADQRENNRLQVAFNNSQVGSSDHMANLGSALQLHVWHHIAVVIENGIKTYYFDGKKLPQQPGTADINTSKFYIGTDPHGAVENLSGAIDDVKIYNRALSEDEVLQIYKE